jgi:hypothetical protein
MDPESFQRLVEAEVVDFKVCEELLGKVNNPLEAGELRGVTIRFLESYPDHPVLLVLRALSESLSDDCEETVVLDSLRTLFGPAISKYAVSDVALNDVVTLIARLAERRAPLLFSALLLALDDTGFQPSSPAFSYKDLVRLGQQHAPDDVADIVRLQRLRKGVAQLRTAAADLSVPVAK